MQLKKGNQLYRTRYHYFSCYVNDDMMYFTYPPILGQIVLLTVNLIVLTTQYNWYNIFKIKKRAEQYISAVILT